MERPKSVRDITCHPDAPKSLHKFIENYKWLFENYSKLVQQFGTPSYVAVHDSKAVDSDKDRMKLLEKLSGKFSEEEYKSICIGEL
jgi:hypothetical protein